jgi:hypothetical protein
MPKSESPHHALLRIHAINDEVGPTGKNLVLDRCGNTDLISGAFARDWACSMNNKPNATGNSPPAARRTAAVKTALRRVVA